MIHRKRKPRIPEVVHLPADFQAVGGGHPHVVMVIPIGDDGSTLGVRFESPEHLLYVFGNLMEKAAKVWPDHELIKEYLSD